MNSGGTGDSTDVRLVGGAGAAWVAVLLCTGRSAGLATVLALLALVFGGCALVAARRSVSGAAALALTAFCVALVLIPFAGRLFRARASPLAELAAQRTSVTAELTLAADPHPLGSSGVAGPPRLAVAADADALVLRGVRHAVDGNVLVLAPAAGWVALLPGQRVLVDGVLQPSLDPGDLSVTLSVRGPPQLLAHPPWWQRAAGAVRADLRQASSGLPDQVRGLLPGLVDGDTSNLDPVLAERFKLAGLTHLVAVSGTNCSILVGAALLVLRRLRVRRGLCALAGGLVVIGFVVVARPSPSVLRAAVMGCIALAALASGRPRQALPVLSAAVIGLLVWDPRLANDAGFTMSVLAIAAILVIAPGWAAALRQRHVPLGLAELIAVAAAAHVVTAPVIAAISGRVSLVAIPANVLAEPVVAAATVLGFLAALLAPLSLGLGASVAWLAGWPTRWLVWVAEWLGGLHGATLSWPGGEAGGLVLLAVIAVLWLLARRAGPRRVLCAAAVVALIVQLPVRSVASGWPPSGWLFVACDVGQGDALVLRAGPHSAVEVDAGPDPVAIDRCLRDLGITDIALLVFTHFHLDHVGGISGALHERHVGRVVAGPLADPAAGVHDVDAALAPRRLTVSTPSPGTHFDVGDVHLDVLGPAGAFHGTRSDPNNSSLVLRATINGVRILLPGDVEVEAQRALLDSRVDPTAEVLKVPHHGSAYSDAGFLAAVHAQVGVISVGLHNDYGHPSPMLLGTMARLGIPVRRTDQDGDVAVCGSLGHLEVVVRGVAASTVG
ncbi:MAG: ComEC/Rec2 family competence protein [Jatrophihabitantaceae bacterium]